jgi:hypothetical protein
LFEWNIAELRAAPGVGLAGGVDEQGDDTKPPVEWGLTKDDGLGVADRDDVGIAAEPASPGPEEAVGQGKTEVFR